MVSICSAKMFKLKHWFDHCARYVTDDDRLNELKFSK
jgi:hypothetical protein